MTESPPAESSDLFASLAAEHNLLHASGTSPDEMPERYLYSHNMRFRYAFGRWWGKPLPSTSDVWVLLNPATGDTELRHRPTLARCLARSQADGQTGVIIVNLFAHRETNPKLLKTVSDPVGPANDAVLRVITHAGARTIVAWGSGGGLHERSTRVTSILERPLCLGTTRQGQPRHPLYVSGGTQLIPWTTPGPS